jgi:Co/Zn/Cd efflux system component
MGNDLHLVSKGFQTCFYVLSFSCALASITYSRERKDVSARYTYGFDRYEVASAFSNSVFLLFIAGFSLMEEVHLFFFPGEATSAEWSSALYCKLFAEFLVFVKLSKYLQRKQPATPTEDNLGVIAIFCFVLLWNDSIALTDSVFLLPLRPGPYQYFRLAGVVAWAVLAVYTVMPYLLTSGRILLQCTPQGSQQAVLATALKDVKQIEGVLEVTEDHFWQFTDDKLVASLVLKVHPSVSHSSVVHTTQGLMRKVAFDVTVETCEP